MPNRAMRFAAFFWFLASSLAFFACGDSDDDGASRSQGEVAEEIPGTRVLFDLSQEGGFYDFPFPTDLLRKDEGGLDLSRYPHGGSGLFIALLDRYVRLAAEHDGFGLSTVSYFRFEAGLNASDFPSTPETLAEESPVFLADVDPSSAEYGRRFPLVMRFYTGADAAHPDNVLALAPLPGFVLSPNTRYAAVVLRALGDAAGEPLGSPLALQQLLHGSSPGGGPAGERARQAYAALVAYLEDRGIPPSAVAAANAFTTGDPVGETERIYDYAASLPPPAPAAPLVRTREYEAYYLLEGAFSAPQFQRGTPPYLLEGGEIVLDAEGYPVRQRDEEIPFALAIPKGPMPAAGWPLVIYIHGTGGVSTQLTDRGRQPDPNVPAPEGTGPALTFAARAIATAGCALPVHPQRGGVPGGMTFYNVLQAAALPDNLRQGMAEQALFLRMLRQLRIDPSLCPETDAALSADGRIGFDAAHLFSMGQSLGSLVLDQWGALEENLVALIPSGTAAHFGTIGLEMREIPFPEILRLLLGTPEDQELDLFHPFLNLITLAWGPADPVNFAKHFFRDPLPGRSAKHVYMSQGFFDSFFPPPSQNAFIASAGLQLSGRPFAVDTFDQIALEREYASPRCGIERPCSESTLETMDYLGLDVADYPVSGNLASGDGGRVTAVVVEEFEDGILDGHNINFQLDGLKYQYGCFLRTLLDTGMPILLEPAGTPEAACD
ncbi:MAG: hypothetical protein AB1640_19685 [bacterium]